MDSPTTYDVVITTFQKGLKAYNHILTKAEEYAKEKGIDANTELFNARLIADQNPLVFQIQNATKVVKVTLGRLGYANEAFVDKEHNFDDLHRRINETLELLSTVDPKVVNAAGEKELEM